MSDSKSKDPVLEDLIEGKSSFTRVAREIAAGVVEYDKARKRRARDVAQAGPEPFQDVSDEPLRNLELGLPFRTNPNSPAEAVAREVEVKSREELGLLPKPVPLTDPRALVAAVAAPPAPVEGPVVEGVPAVSAAAEGTSVPDVRTVVRALDVEPTAPIAPIAPPSGIGRTKAALVGGAFVFAAVLLFALGRTTAPKVQPIGIGAAGSTAVVGVVPSVPASPLTAPTMGLVPAAVPSIPSAIAPTASASGPSAKASGRHSPSSPPSVAAAPPSAPPVHVPASAPVALPTPPTAATPPAPTASAPRFGKFLEEEKNK